MITDPFTIRAPRREDFAAVLNLQNAVDMSECGIQDSVAEDLETDWKHARFDLTRDAWVVEDPNGQLAGYAYLHDDRPGVEFTAGFFMRPAAAAGSAPAMLGPRLLARIEARAREMHAAAGTTEKATISVFCPAASRLRQGCLEGGRYKPMRSFLRMAIDMAKGPPPLLHVEKISIRPFRRNADAEAVWQLVNQTFHDHFRYIAKPFEEWKQERIGHPKFDPMLCQVAWDKTELVGALLATRFDDLGWIHNIGVRKSHRGKGIGSALLLAALNAFYERGQPIVHLGVDTQNASGAARLYERAGMCVYQRWDVYQKKL